MAKPHEVLGLPPLGSSWDVVRARYRELAMKHHPDRGGNIDNFRRIQTAYEALRAKYEQQGVFDDIFSEVQQMMRRPGD